MFQTERNGLSLIFCIKKIETTRFFQQAVDVKLEGKKEKCRFNAVDLQENGYFCII